MATQPPIKLVIADLDGTLIETETLVLGVARNVIRSHGKELTEEAIAASLGRRPIEAWEAVADILSIEQTPEQLFQQSEVLLTDRWHEAAILPGADRLITHLKQSGVPLALATSTSRKTLERKLSSKPSLRDAFDCICCGDDDDLAAGKPAPDCFLKVAKERGIDPKHCLVLEDAPCGVAAAIAAGMRVVVIPSMRSTTCSTDLYPGVPNITAHAGVVEHLPSLLSFIPEKYGLPPFNDFIDGTIPLDPGVWRISGTVVRGFGRGSKELGIPTANVDSVSLAASLAEAVTGIYAGWAAIGADVSTVYPMVMSVGWNPVFGNKHKTCEPWILHAFDKPFYGEQIRLVVVAYIRPESNFDSLQALIDRIHLDGKVTKQALMHERYRKYQTDEFLLTVQ